MLPASCPAGRPGARGRGGTLGARRAASETSQQPPPLRAAVTQHVVPSLPSAHAPVGSHVSWVSLRAARTSERCSTWPEELLGRGSSPRRTVRPLTAVNPGGWPVNVAGLGPETPHLTDLGSLAVKGSCTPHQSASAVSQGNVAESGGCGAPPGGSRWRAPLAGGR